MKKLVCIPILFVLLSCKDAKVIIKSDPFSGPVIKAFDLKTVLSDSAKIKVTVETPLQLEYQNGNQEYPKGVTVTFFNQKGEAYTRLTADKGKFTKNQNIYVVYENVLVRNMQKQEELSTVELFWNPQKQEIYTNQNVKIVTAKEILYGTGLTAKQDFMSCKITKPTGKFTVQQ